MAPCSTSASALAKTDIVFANRPGVLFAKYIGCNYSAIASSSYGPHLRNLGRIITVEILSCFIEQSLCAIGAGEVQSLLRGLFRDSEAGKDVVELKSKFSELSFQIIMGMIGDNRYYGENIVDLEEAKQFQRIVKETTELGGASNIGDFVAFFGWFDFGGVEKRMMRLVKKRDEYLQDLIDEQNERERRMMKFPLWQRRGRV